MREIKADARSVKSLLKDEKYGIDYYQREYRWRKKQVQDLIEDLTTRFLGDHEVTHPRSAVAGYGHYFLGPIITTQKHSLNYIVDGQQRLTTLTLLLIHLNNLQQEHETQVPIADLIFSEQYGEKTFNIRADKDKELDERHPVMAALFAGAEFDAGESSESVQNIVARFEDIQELLPVEVTGASLLYFIDWLIENVHLVEIRAYADEDAYTIFETMNDRGLNLTPSEMLKGYLLSNISEARQKSKANKLWKQRVLELNNNGRDSDADFFKAWLRSQHANSIRERKSGAKPQEFDRIGTEFHRFVREHSSRLGLNGSDSYFEFIQQQFDFYSRQYLRLLGASKSLTAGLEHVLYNAQHGFTLQYMVLLAPLKRDDPPGVINEKLRLVGTYLDIMLNHRLWNFRSIAYSTMQYTMFNLMRDIRGKAMEELAEVLRSRLDEESETFSTNDRLRVHQQNRKYLHRIIARIADYVDQESGVPTSRYPEYTMGRGNKRYEIEHIWANKYERHKVEFAHQYDFNEYRNRIGGLLIVPKPFNISYGALPYDEKLTHYNSQNLLARSLHPDCYNRNPGFCQFVKRSNLPFRPHRQFKKEDMDARYDLYRQIAQKIWDPDKVAMSVSR
jgi:uncharacterized protein with ParB-like and HNH nuclease domain